MQPRGFRFTVAAGAGAASPTLGDNVSHGWLVDQNICDWVLGFADRHRWLLWMTVLVFYLAAFNGQWRIQPDAALYLSIGRNLAHGSGYTYLGQPERLAHPGWPAVIALTFKLFSSKSLVPVHAVILIISLLTVAAVYRLFLIHADRPTAIVVSVGTGLTKAFFCYAFELWSDMPFALGVMCALAGYEGLSVNFSRTAESKRPPSKLTLDVIFLIGGLLIAATMRPTIWPLLFAIVLASFFPRRPQAQLDLGVARIDRRRRCDGWHRFDVWLWPGMHGVGTEYGQFLINRLSGRDSGRITHPMLQNVWDLFTWAASDVLFQTRLGPVVNALLSFFVLALGVGLFRYRALWGLWFCFLLPTILMSQVTLDRYFLPVLPLLVYAWWDFMVETNRRLQRPLANLAFLALIAFGGLMNVTKVAGIITQQHEHPFLARYDQGRFDDIPEFSRKVHDSVGDKALVLLHAPYGRVTAYLSERYVTGAIGTTLEQLQTHRVFVVEPSDIDTQHLLKSAGLVEGPALFTVNPTTAHGPWATSLSLHSTQAIRPNPSARSDSSTHPPKLTFSQRSSSVAYTLRKSVVYFRSPLSSFCQRWIRPEQPALHLPAGDETWARRRRDRCRWNCSPSPAGQTR